MNLLAFFSTCLLAGLLSAFLGAIVFRFISTNFTIAPGLTFILCGVISFFSYVMLLRLRGIDWLSYRQLGWLGGWSRGLLAKKFALGLGGLIAALGAIVYGQYLLIKGWPWN